MRRWLLLLGLFTGGLSDAEAACVRAGERPEARGSGAVITREPIGRTRITWRVCDEKTGRRRVLLRGFDDQDGSREVLQRPRFAPGWVGFVQHIGSRYEVLDYAVAVSTTNGARRSSLAFGVHGGLGDILIEDLAVDTAGRLTWIAEDSAASGAFVMGRDNRERRLDEAVAGAIRDVAITETHVTWRHRRARRATPITPQVDRCPRSHPLFNTDAAVLVEQAAKRAVGACLRARGLVVSFAPTDYNDVLLAGPYAAALVGDDGSHSVRVVDLRTGDRMGQDIPLIGIGFAADVFLVADGTVVVSESTREVQRLVAHRPDGALQVLWSDFTEDVAVDGMTIHFRDNDRRHRSVALP